MKKNTQYLSVSVSLPPRSYRHICTEFKGAEITNRYIACEVGQQRRTYIFGPVLLNLHLDLAFYMSA